MSDDERTFTCEMCDETFIAAWSDEEALAEMREKFGDIPRRERARVCSDCCAILDASAAGESAPSVIFQVWQSKWQTKPGIACLQSRPITVQPDASDDPDEVITPILSFRCIYPESIDAATLIVFHALTFQSWEVANAMPKAES